MRESRSGAGCLIAFGIPFVGIAMYMGITALRLHAIGTWPRLVAVYACIAVAFGLSGFGLIAAVVWHRPRPLEDPDLRAAHPDQPWLWRQEWTSRRLSDQSRSGAFVLWGFALLWNAITSPVFIYIPDQIRKGHLLAWIGVLFPLAGALLLINAVRLTIRRLRFGGSTLLLDAVPVPVGGVLRGTVEVPHSLSRVSGVKIRLVALAKRRHGGSTSDSIACHEEREIHPSMLRLTGEGVAIPIEIAVPDDAPATDTSDSALQVFWRLDVHAAVPGVDYHAAFDIPVFRSRFGVR